MKIAVATKGISHFEAPLFRLYSDQTDFEIRVFYLDEVYHDAWYDSEYQCDIHWGEKVLSGYDSQRCSGPRELWNRLQRWSPDVVLVYGYSWAGAAKRILWNRFRGIPQIHRGTLNYHRDPRRPVQSFFFRPIRKHLLRFFNAHHFGGSYSRKVLIDAGVPESSMFLVPYSVDSSYFVDRSDELHDSSKKPRENLGWGPQDKVILFIGQHNWVKGPDIAMQVISQFQGLFPETRALIVGHGRMTAGMKEYASRHLTRNSYFFTGFLPSKSTVEYYLASDVVIFTSRYETWARAVNEAMLCRRVCIVNKIMPVAGGLVDHGRNGYVVDGPVPAEYVAMLKEYFSLPRSMQDDMRRGAREKAVEMSYERHVEDLRLSIEYAKANGGIS